MELTARPYRSHLDLAKMRQLLVTGSQANIPASYIHPGVLDWATHNPPDEQANQRNILLWERADDGQPTLQAWAIYLSNEGSFDLFVHPELHGKPLHEAVMDKFVAWGETRAREVGVRELWPWWAMDYDTVLTRLMQDRGYVVTQADPPPPLFERTLDDLPPIQLPDGFTVQGVRSLDDGRLRARVTYDAFGSNDDWDDYWADYAQFIGSEVYDGERDLLVRTPGGRGASVCTIWFVAVNGVGLFEPVATHPVFQGRGLGKAVMAEGLRRMRAAGMKRAILGFEPDNAAALALYSSMGFEASAYFVVCAKKL
jgi:mycothiol synthase